MTARYLGVYFVIDPVTSVRLATDSWQGFTRQHCEIGGG